MYERSLNSAELILSSHKDIMTVRSVWEEVAKRSQAERFEVASLPDFSAMLDGDKRFQIVPAQIKSEESSSSGEDLEGEDAEMGQLGFFPEDRVRLCNMPIAPPEPSEAEEEVGSIRRRAFVSSSLKAKPKQSPKQGKASKSAGVKKSAPKKKVAAKRIKVKSIAAKTKNKIRKAKPAPQGKRTHR